MVSGTDVRRPWGQVLQKGSDQPAFKPSSKLDFELEMVRLRGGGEVYLLVVALLGLMALPLSLCSKRPLAAHCVCAVV